MTGPQLFTVNPGMGVLLADMGVSVRNVLRRAGLPADLFVRGNVGLSTGEYFALWEAMEAEAGDTNLPLRLGEVLSLEVFDPPIFAAACSPDLNVAASRIAEYKKLMGPVRLSVVRTPSRTTVEYVWPDGGTPPSGLAAGELVFWVALTRLATRVEVVPVEVTMPEPPADARAYREYLGVTIRQGAEQTVVFSARDAELPFVTANAGLWAFFEPQLRKRLAELEAGATMVARVRGALLELLPSGKPTMDAVARELAVSTRTLQRRLSDEGTTFQTVLGETRESLAKQYLAHSALSTGEIAFLLGYEEPNSFYRAFRSWTGETPDRVRAGALNDSMMAD